MERGLYIAASGMASEMVRQDQLANDLANASTPGYKADRTAQQSFGNLLLDNSLTGRQIGPQSTAVQVRRIQTDFTPQPLRDTGEPLDFGITGEGFFAVRTGQGVRYTRNGQFTVSPQGELVTAQGDPVLGRGGQPIRVGADGKVDPRRLDVVLLNAPRKAGDGLVTGTPGGVPTNRPVEGATVEVFRTDPGTGARLGEALHRRVTGADGRWGPLAVASDWTLEFVVAAPAHPVTHLYRSPFARSSGIVHLRPGRPLGPGDAGAGAVVLMSRPRGYFGLPRDIVLLDGREPTDLARGVPADSVTTLRLPASDIGRPVVAQFNEERIVARAWSAAENRLVIAELTY
jgi:hypothetical protein